MPSEDNIERAVVEQIRFPDRMQVGRYDRFGRKDEGGNLFVGAGGEIYHVWGVFERALAPGQLGIMDFTNVPGSYTATGNVTTWLKGEPGFAPHVQNGGLLGSKAALVKWELGVWDVEVDVFLKPGDSPLRVSAVETNRLSSDGWCVTDYVAPEFLGLTFEQHLQFGFDEARQAYVATRTKTFQANIAVFRQIHLDEKKRQLVLEGEVENSDGTRETERRITTYVDRRTKRFTVERKTARGDYQLSDRGTAIRRAPAFTGNVPQMGATPLTLVALQRSQGAARLTARNDGPAAVDAAAGIVVLGPIWGLQFGDSARL